jgi:hypothetical protein
MRTNALAVRTDAPSAAQIAAELRFCRRPDAFCAGRERNGIALRTRSFQTRLYVRGLPFIYRDGMTLTFRLFFVLERIFDRPFPGRIYFLDLRLPAGKGITVKLMA